jgi:hypothetical protein
MKRALRERRERPDVLDLVSKELDSNWLSPGARNTSTSPPRTAICPCLGSLDTL